MLVPEVFTDSRPAGFSIPFRRASLDSDLKRASDGWLSASAGKVVNVVLYPTGVGDRLRLTFGHDAAGLDIAEFRAVLKNGDKNISETWLYRWTP